MHSPTVELILCIMQLGHNRVSRLHARDVQISGCPHINVPVVNSMYILHSSCAEGLHFSALVDFQVYEYHYQ